MDPRLELALTEGAIAQMKNKEKADLLLKKRIYKELPRAKKWISKYLFKKIKEDLSKGEKFTYISWHSPTFPVFFKFSMIALFDEISKIDGLTVKWSIFKNDIMIYWD
jgi:hypothetical protein